MRRMRPAVILLAVTLLAAFFSAAAIAQEIKIASLAQDGTAWMKAMRAAGDAIAKETRGRVQFKFYPGGVMGNDSTVCPGRPNIDHLCRLNIDQGREAAVGAANCG